MIPRFLPTSGVDEAKFFSSRIVPDLLADLTAWSPTWDAWPRELNEGREASEKGPRSLKKRVSWPLDALRSRSAGVCSSATRPRAAIVGRSSSRKPGSLAQVPARSTLRLADASDVRRAATTQRPTSGRWLGRAGITVSGLVGGARVPG